MNKPYQEILSRIKQAANTKNTTLHSGNYHGSSHLSYNVTTADSRRIAKEWATEHQNIPIEELIEALNALSEGESSDEKRMIGKILGYLPKRRKEIDPKFLDHWLDDLVGWAEVDSLCQSNFTDEDLLSNWEEWAEVLNKLSRDESISKRRASLVLLTRPVSHNDDQRLADVAFENIERLKTEKSILITKAISWLMRDLIRHHKYRVELYLEQKKATLPKIAVREVSNKLRTGKK